MVWYTDSSTIEFGIPRRPDGEVRLEIQESALHSASATDRMVSVSFQ